MDNEKAPLRPCIGKRAELTEEQQAKQTIEILVSELDFYEKAVLTSEEANRNMRLAKGMLQSNNEILEKIMDYCTEDPDHYELCAREVACLFRTAQQQFNETEEYLTK